MASVVFNDEQEQKISDITGCLISSQPYRQSIISTYFNNPQYLSIYVIYALEELSKGYDGFAFNRGICQKLEQYAGENLSDKTYSDYDEFMSNWKNNSMFRNQMRKRFENNEIGSLNSSDIVAYGVIQTSESCNYLEKRTNRFGSGR